ncbi:NAD(P)H-flavin reductase [Gallaecimonas sp. GXIMD4217]|uniref:NAD(P)H-flavin reductase n=1 Tax=Gallaecimonas sp. GXIMD4217 TaxID=3131927 RepID=UPI00311B1016
MQRISCQIESLTPFSDTVFRVLLKPQSRVEFKAGQYLKVVMSEEDKRPFSIASLADDDHIELHIGAFGPDSWAMQVIDRLEATDEIDIELPGGEAFLDETSQAPVVLVAGGTGFSYTNAILQRLLKAQPQRQVTLYWGGKIPEALYMHDAMAALAREHQQFRYVPVVEDAPEHWDGEAGLVVEAVVHQLKTLGDYQFYIAGRFEMAGVARELFLEHGADRANIKGDAFAFI